MDLKLKKILIVDDEETLLEILFEELKDSFKQVFVAASAKEAEKILEREAIDLVITDIHMSKKNGLVFFGDYKKKHPESEIGWVFMSADTSPETISSACRLGVIDFVQKPFTTAQVKGVLEAIESRKENSSR